jgi:peptide/nickel transport system substrate-binding protein
MTAGTAALASLVMVLAACGSSSSGGGGGGGTGGGGSTAQRGGTLNMLGAGDVDFMDPNLSYFTTGYLGLRMWSRQLYSYPAVQGHATDTTPDLATAAPVISNGGKTYKVTIKKGVMWNTSPARQITAADEVRGVERQCNPAQPFGGLPDYESLIVGMAAFCGVAPDPKVPGSGSGFAKVSPNPAAIAAYMKSHSISGVSVDPSDPQTVIFKLAHAATYFTGILAIPSMSPAPVEEMKYVPGSATAAQHTISDGPYTVASYNPAHTITFTRNPSWQASTDTLRKAYVDKILVNETGNTASIQQQLQAGTQAADMDWDAQVPPADLPGLITAKSPGLELGPTFSLNPYAVYNEKSPNNSGALAKVAVRQALNEAINRTQLVQDQAGPQVAPPQSHILPPGIDGSQNFDPYPYNVAKAKAILAPLHLKLKVIYQPAVPVAPKAFQTIQSDLGQVGVSVSGVTAPTSDFYTKYLEVPAVASRGVWDIALTGWFPDWYGNSALSYLGPLFNGQTAFPPNGSNFGFYNNPKTNTLIQQASTATSPAAATALWAKADKQVMTDAAIFPITSSTQPVFHAAQVHNAVYVPNLANFDPTNVWLDSSKNGG